MVGSASENLSGQRGKGKALWVTHPVPNEPPGDGACELSLNHFITATPSNRPFGSFVSSPGGMEARYWNELFLKYALCTSGPARSRAALSRRDRRVCGTENAELDGAAGVAPEGTTLAVVFPSAPLQQAGGAGPQKAAEVQRGLCRDGQVPVKPRLGSWPLVSPLLWGHVGLWSRWAEKHPGAASGPRVPGSGCRSRAGPELPSPGRLGDLPCGRRCWNNSQRYRLRWAGGRGDAFSPGLGPGRGCSACRLLEDAAGGGSGAGQTARVELLRLINRSEHPAWGSAPARHRVLPPPGPASAARAESGAGPLN